MSDTALLIIDVQNDYFPGGAMELSNPAGAAANIRILLDTFRASGQPVVHIQHENLMPDLPFMLPGTEGQKIHAKVLPAEGEMHIVKHFPNSFRQTGLEEILREKGIQKLLITGMMTHMCVSATTRAAMELGFLPTIVQDACATTALEFRGETIPAETVHRTALAEVGLFTDIVDTRDMA
jgi:nicotinamidase-related amidase